MWIHLLALRLIDGAGGIPIPPVPDVPTGGATDGIGGIAIGYPYNLPKPKKTLEIVKESNTITRKKEVSAQIVDSQKRAEELQRELDRVQSSGLALLAAQELLIKQYQEQELSRQLQLELDEEEEMLALLLML